MDNYIEQIIEKKPDIKQRLLFLASVLLTVFGVSIMIFWNMGLGAIVTAVGGFLIYVAKNQQSQEYEYVFVNCDCDITRITNKQNRKEIFSLKGGDVQKVISYNSQEFDNEQQAHPNLVIKDFTSGDKSKQNDWHVFIVNNMGKTLAVGLELNDKTKEYVETYYKNKYNRC